MVGIIGPLLKTFWHGLLLNKVIYTIAKEVNNALNKRKQQAK